MMVQIEVEVMIRKGLGPEHINRNFSVGFDDLPEETTNYEIEQMAKAEVEQQLRNTEDYPIYGKNWKIISYNHS